MTSLKPPLDLTKSRVLVTGATGQIGRHLVQALIRRGASVAVLTRSPSRAHSLFSENVEIRRGDLCDAGGLERAVNNVDVVFHLASFSSSRSRGSIYEDPRHWDVTVKGTDNLLKAATGLGCRRFVYFSSIKAMGEDVGGEGHPATESLQAAPETLYGKAKLAAEKAIINAVDQTQGQATILRLPMVYGLVGHGNLEKMLDAVARKRFPPFPKHLNRRSAIHALDAVDAALLSVVRGGAGARIYLVTDGNGYSTRWIYEQIRVALGREIPGWTLPLWCWRSAARLGTVAERLSGTTMPVSDDAIQKLFGNAWFSPDRIRAELGYRPSHELGAEIQRMAARYLRGSGRMS